MIQKLRTLAAEIQTAKLQRSFNGASGSDDCDRTGTHLRASMNWRYPGYSKGRNGEIWVEDTDAAQTLASELLGKNKWDTKREDSTNQTKSKSNKSLEAPSCARGTWRAKLDSCYAMQTTFVQLCAFTLFGHGVEAPQGVFFRSSQTRKIRNKKHIVSHCVTCQCSKTVQKTCQETLQTVTDISALSLNLFQPVSACFSLFQPSSEVGAHHMARPSRFQVAGADPVDCGKKDKASGHAEHLKPGFTLSKPWNHDRIHEANRKEKLELTVIRCNLLNYDVIDWNWRTCVEYSALFRTPASSEFVLRIWNGFLSNHSLPKFRNHIKPSKGNAALFWIQW